MQLMVRYMVICTLLFLGTAAVAQCPHTIDLRQKWDIPFSFPSQCMATVPDEAYDYLYVAAKKDGLLVYDIATSAPAQAAQIKIDQLQNLEVMNLSKVGQYLYLALGNHFGTAKQQAGMAIINVSSPWNPVVEDAWVLPNSNSGAGIVIADGNYAYLGAMLQGLVILDISAKNNIQHVSTFKPDFNYPVSNPDTLKYNVRGMELGNNYLYTCYDAGGIRIINVTDKQNPKEAGRYSLPILNNRPRAYNNIVLNYPLAYVATDYCGMEILNIGDTANITQTGWWNPWQCEVPSANNWFNSPGHTNELAHSPGCKVVFLSSGKSELCVVNVQNPSNPFLCDSFGSVNNQQGTWGMDLHYDKLYLSYIFVPLGVPFFSNWSGVKALSWNYMSCGLEVQETEHQPGVVIYPNPSMGNFTVKTNDLKQVGNIEISDITGRTIYRATCNKSSIEIGLEHPGIYFLKLQAGEYRYYDKIVTR